MYAIFAKNKRGDEELLFSWRYSAESGIIRAEKEAIKRGRFDLHHFRVDAEWCAQHEDDFIATLEKEEDC